MMEIKLEYCDVIEALETYLVNEYGIKRSLSDLTDCPSLDIQQWQAAYKKKVTHCLSFGEGDTITLYLGKTED